MQAIRNLAEDWKARVECCTSSLGIRGLRAKRAFEDAEPVLIYAGEILDQEMSEKRTKFYASKYKFLTNYQIMFDKCSNETNEVFYVDCTRKGNMGGLANCVNGLDNCSFVPVSRFYVMHHINSSCS